MEINDEQQNGFWSQHQALENALELLVDMLREDASMERIWRHLNECATPRRGIEFRNELLGAADVTMFIVAGRRLKTLIQDRAQ